jgi:Tol biopolymer transport system component
VSGEDDTVDAAAHTVPSSGASAHLGARDGAGPRQIGRYRILRVIGRGGMGTVYAAHDPELGRDVALKSLLELAGKDRLRADRLRREAQALARVVHTNVVAVYDAGIDGDTPFLVMQLVDGVTLDEHLRNGPVRGVDEILGLFVQAGRGLCAIHDAKLVHRDVKPANLLVDREGVVRVSDLGLARLGSLGPSTDSSSGDGAGPPRGSDVTSGTLTRGVAGTPAYMAPEQFADGEVTAAADQFSFCVSLWEALFGARPFPGGTIDELLAAIKAGRTREPVHERRVPANVVRVIRRGLSPRPDDRFPSMAVLLAELQPRTRRRFVLAGAVVALGVGVGALAIAGGEGAAKRGDRAVVLPVDAAVKRVASFATDRSNRVTFADACEEFPSFSPDGKTVYFDGQVGASYHLFALDVASGAVAELTHTDGWDFAPSASPDGKYLAWVRREEAAQSTWVAEVADLKTARRLSVGPARPTWSPDGTHVWTGDRAALVRRDVVTGAEGRRIEPPDEDVPLLGLELVDGRFVMLGASSASSGLADVVYLYPAAGGAPEVLWRREGLEEVLALAPEGDAVFVAPIDPDGNTNLMRVPLDGAEPTKLAEGRVPAHKQLAISHGKAVWSDCSEQTSLAKVGMANGKPALEDLARNTWADAFPEAILGTTRFVFVSDRAEGVRLWEQDLARPGPAKRIPFGDIEPSRFAVSPDGTHIAAAEGSTGLYVAPIDGSTPPLKLVADPGDLQPAFSRDGTEIFFERTWEATWRIAAVSVTGGEPRWITAGAGASPAPSPTEDVLAYLAPTDEAAEVVLLDLRTGKERTLAGTHDVPWTGVRWTPDGKRLLLIRSDAHVAEVDATTGRELRRVETGSAMLVGATMVGDAIVVGRTKWAGDLWMTDVVSPRAAP